MDEEKRTRHCKNHNYLDCKSQVCLEEKIAALEADLAEQKAETQKWINHSLDIEKKLRAKLERARMG